MDELNQTQNQQNPNMNEPVQPEPAQPTEQLGQIYQKPYTPGSSSSSKKNLWILLMIIVVVGGVILGWLYYTNLSSEMPIVQEPEIDREAREDFAVDGEIRAVDLGDVDKEFEDIDREMGNL